MIRLIAKKRGLFLAVAILAMVAPGVAYARNGSAEEVKTVETTQSETSDDSNTVTSEQEDTPETGGTDLRHSGEDRIEAAREKAESRVVAAKARLEKAQLKRCEAQEKAITNIMARIADRGQKQLDLFGTIADRVQAFYEEKGNTLDNYDDLVSEVNAKRDAAQNVVDDISTSDTTFSCDSDNPHGIVDGFKDSLKQEISALKEYRTAVKNLIVGVKSVQPADTTDATNEGAQE